MEFFNKALEEFKNKHYESSIIYFEKSIIYKFNIDTSYFNIGVCYMKLNNYETSLIMFNFINNNEEIPNILYQKGVCNFHIANYKQSLANYFKIFSHSHTLNEVIINNNIAVNYIKLKEYEKGLEYLKKCIKLDHNYVSSYINIGECYNKLNKYNQSLEFSYMGLKLNNNDPKNTVLIYNNIGVSYMRLKKYKKACIYLDKCIKLDKSYLSSYNNKSLCEYHIGNIKNAIDILKTIYKNNKNIIMNSEVENLIKYYFDLEQYNQIKDILNSDKQYYKNFKNRIYLALIFYINGNYKKFNEIIIINNQNIKNIDKTDDVRFVIPYNNLLNILSKYIIFDNQPYSDIIYHIGDSHSLSTTNKYIEIKNKTYKFQTKLIIGCKAWHLNNMNHLNNYKTNFINKVNYILQNKQSKYIIISVGEIDCRSNEGILVYHNKSGKSIEDIIVNTVKNYVEFLTSLFKKNNNLHIFLCNVPYPKNRDDKIIQIIDLFNKTLDFYISNTSFKLLDIHSLTRKDNLFYIDNHHLSFDIYKKALLYSLN